MFFFNRGIPTGRQKNPQVVLAVFSHIFGWDDLHGILSKPAS
jgi:hypothetical protein